MYSYILGGEYLYFLTIMRVGVIIELYHFTLFLKSIFTVL